MKFNKTVASKLASILAVAVRVSTTSIQGVHSDNAGADLAFVNVEYGLAGIDGSATSIQLIAKLRSGKRFCSIPTEVGGDGKRRPRFYLKNELRAVLQREVFRNAEINALAEKYEAILAGQESSDFDGDADVFAD